MKEFVKNNAATECATGSASAKHSYRGGELCIGRASGTPPADSSSRVSGRVAVWSPKRRPNLERAVAAAKLLLAVLLFPLTSFAQEAPDNNSATETPATDIRFSGISPRDARTELLTWLAQAGSDEQQSSDITKAWADDDELDQLVGEELLDRIVWSFGQVDRATQQLIDQSYGADLPQELVFDGIRAEQFYQNQVNHFRARWLAQHRFYDEALPLLEALDPDDVVDPAGLLFYRAVCQSELLKRSEALDSLALLLNNTMNVPPRFEVLAQMLQKKLADQKGEGIYQVALLMKDVERRLDLGRSGEDTQNQGDEVIAALDKLLEEMEQQQQQQNGGGGGGAQQQNQGGAQAANQSQIKGGPADGEADRKELSEKGNWGMLDQQAEAKTRELIRQKFPSNFLGQIGLYTRKIAEKKK